MNCIFRGERVTNEEFLSRLPILQETINKDLQSNNLEVDDVLSAIDQLQSNINLDEIKQKLIHLGIPDWTISEYIKTSLKNITKEQLQFKVEKELGQNPFTFKEVLPNTFERFEPLGVLFHIGAGNTLGLAAFSVLEGLLTKNINILKLPEMEGGISTEILMKLIEIEPKLKPYIYVINISSKNQEVIQKLVDITDGVIVWGSDLAVDSLRKLTPPHIKLIEWGHRISFAYFNQNSNLKEDILGLARDIIITDQLYCSSPQVVFYETDHVEELHQFGTDLYNAMDELNKAYPNQSKPLNIMSEITWTHELLKAEEILGEKKLLKHPNSDFSVMIDYIPVLKPSPLFRNIWLMPIKRVSMFEIIRKEKGHLQTVGLSVDNKSLEELTNLLYRAGISRIMKPGTMSDNYAGEPHDGDISLTRYTKKVNRNY